MPIITPRHMIAMLAMALVANLVGAVAVKAIAAAAEQSSRCQTGVCATEAW